MGLLGYNMSELFEGEMRFQALAMAKEVHNQLASTSFIDMLAVMAPENPAKKEVQELEGKINDLTTAVGAFIQKYIPDVAAAEPDDVDELPEPEDEEDEKPAPKKQAKDVKPPKKPAPKKSEDDDEDEETPKAGKKALKESDINLSLSALNEKYSDTIKHIIKQIKQASDIDSIVDIISLKDQVKAVFRAKDGTLYNLSIKPEEIIKLAESTKSEFRNFLKKY